MTTFRDKLESLNACHEACIWVGDKTADEAWATCERGDWMLWLLGRLSGEPGSDVRRKLAGAAAECAELALPIYEAKHPGDRRVRGCIEGCKRYAAGEITDDELQVLRRAADDAAYATYTAAYAAYAAARAARAADAAARAARDAAAYAADAAAYAARAADAAAADATYAADAADARKTTLKRCADIVRSHYPKAPEL